MSSAYLTALAFVQGLTEFFPVSSSAHLVLVDRIAANLNWTKPNNTLLYHVAAHLGVLFAVCIYLFRDITALCIGVKDIALGKTDTEESTLLLQLIVVTLPLVALGLLFKDFFESSRSLTLVAVNSIVFGLILWGADKLSLTVVKLRDLKYSRFLFIGCAQVLSLFPGVSRSGIVLTAARLVKLERSEVVRLLLLTSIPAILGSTILQLPELTSVSHLEIGGLLYLVVASAIFGWFAIIVLSVVAQRLSLLPFILYRLAFGFFLLIGIFAGFL